MAARMQKYVPWSMEYGITMHHHLVCAIGNNAMKHSYIVPPPPTHTTTCFSS